MRAFSYERPSDLQAAIKAAGTSPDNQPPTQAAAQFIAGGTNMSDYMKLNVNRPERLIDLNKLSEPAMTAIRVDDAGLHLGALVRMSDAQEHEDVVRMFPVISDSLRLAASGQIRNMASLGGNLLQRTRCEYFREVSWPCNKREPGAGCSALDGVNRQHAVLGGSEACIATYHGDFAQALIALDAEVEIARAKGSRRMPFADLHKLPQDTPQIETALSPSDIIVAIHVPSGPWRRSRYLKVRDRESYAFALASAAVALDMDGDTVRGARIALGGVATVPWRAKSAEEMLTGRKLDEAAAKEAADTAFAEASGRKHNAYKIPLGKQTLVRALLETQDMKV
ncbi:xanthine dehydrogenase family protein subunit M [Tianweitania sp.]|uniref:FAD binding domain-containing protein n=1 Tax=Tianweitania sp. TaxID=2021634 RepID=UPI0028973C47|nr:xanthine dehydrogenase family protein subunit M [Tianweitania sp.]